MASTTGNQSKCPAIQWDYLAGGCPAHSGYDRIADIAKLGPVLDIEPTDVYPGYFMATDFATITEVLQDPQRFSSSAVVALEPDPPYKWIPEMLDPPEHTTWRKLLAPFFTPAAVANKYDSLVRARCVELIDNLIASDTIDFTNEFARQYPTTVFLEIFGLPRDDFEQFMEWEGAIMHSTSEHDPDRSKMRAAMDSVLAYFAELIAKRRADPNLLGDDVLSAALTWEIDGEPVRDQDLLAFCLFVFIAGLDTVTAQLGYMFLHLATHDEHRERIIEDPSIAPKAVEELLRAYPIVVTGRKATVDTELAGVPIRAGETIMVPLQAAGRDEGQYANPETVDFDRKISRHIAFGVGPHRCLGSHLARLELRVALEEWHRRIPNYSLANPDITEHTAGTWGVDQLMLKVHR